MMMMRLNEGMNRKGGVPSSNRVCNSMKEDRKCERKKHETLEKRCFMKTGGYDARSSNKSKVPVLVFKKES